MKIPCDICNFKNLREQGYLYIDKTEYIEALEELGNRILFLRPARFGKSLFLSTLYYYYDINSKENFKKLFKQLYIGQDPTSLRNNYLVMKLNFSGLNTENLNEFEKSFKLNLINSVKRFVKNYKSYFYDFSILETKMDDNIDIKLFLNNVYDAVNETNKKIYLMIDEYDGFADVNFYKNIYNSTMIIKNFYEGVKIGTESVIDRIFITGKLPILNNLVENFNIVEDLTMNVYTNEMLGFTEKEVKSIIKDIDDEQKSQEFIKQLKKNYYGYLFSKNSNQRVFNPDMVLNFLNKWDIFDNYPENIVDNKAYYFYKSLDILMSNTKSKKFLSEVIINKIVMTDISNISEKKLSRQCFLSILFYMGFLTIQKLKYDKLILGISNYLIKIILLKYFEQRLTKEYGLEYKIEEIAKANWELAFEGNIKTFLDYICNRVLKSLDDDKIKSEYIDTIFCCYIIKSNFYKPAIIKGENGWSYIYLEKNIAVPEVKYEWFIKLKYVAMEERLENCKIKRKNSKVNDINKEVTIIFKNNECKVLY